MLVVRRDCCPYCLFEQVIPEDSRQTEILSKPLKPGHPRRLIVEELCNTDDGEDCDMKRIAMHFFHGERAAMQLDCVEIFKYEESEREGVDIGWTEAFIRWGVQKGDACFAQRFREVYDWGRNRLTTRGMYDIIVADAHTYRLAKALTERIQRKIPKTHEPSLK